MATTQIASRGQSVEPLKGVVIAEGLDDPTIIGQFTVYKAAISPPTRPIDSAGTLGRRHYYWITCAPEEASAVAATLRAHLLPDWYAHLWDSRRIVVVFHDRVFELDRHDRSTWAPATEHGLALGITAKELDFLTD